MSGQQPLSATGASAGAAAGAGAFRPFVPPQISRGGDVKESRLYGWNVGAAQLYPENTPFIAKGKIGKGPARKYPAPTTAPPTAAHIWNGKKQEWVRSGTRQKLLDAGHTFSGRGSQAGAIKARLKQLSLTDQTPNPPSTRQLQAQQDAAVRMRKLAADWKTAGKPGKWTDYVRDHARKPDSASAKKKAAADAKKAQFPEYYALKARLNAIRAPARANRALAKSASSAVYPVSRR